MSCDKLVYDLSSETEGSPNVFIRKDWLNILDNQNQNYNSNQSVIDTSQLSNSNKWMSYREAYVEIPLILTLGTSTVGTGVIAAGFNGGVSSAGCIGLKNWFGSIIHSFTLDYNGTTIVQQTPYINMWNAFKLLTTLSWGDVLTQGPHIGFYPDNSDSWTFDTLVSSRGVGVENNGIYNWKMENSVFGNDFTSAASRLGGTTKRNDGYALRMSYIAFDPSAQIGVAAGPIAINQNNLIPDATTTAMWRSYLTGINGNVATRGWVQYQIMATVYLKHIHSFFNMCPLLKGVYMKMTMNLNNSSCQFTALQSTAATVGASYNPGSLTLVSASNAVNGVLPFMISSSEGSAPALAAASAGQISCYSGGAPITAFTGGAAQPYYANISVGKTILDATLRNAVVGVTDGSLSGSIFLYVPSYVFNPVFEQAYLSSPVKVIKYTDVYQYQVINQAAGSQINSLITNGIANIKSILVIPFFSVGAANSGLTIPQFQSPFDTAGCGTTAPLIALNNFNIVVSGQNAIYNTEKYAFEHFVNQTYGVNAVNGGLTDGLTSGLINYKDWLNNYCYYYVNVERMLPVEQSVPKSIQLVGTNATSKSLDLWVFVEYGNVIQIDAITGARV